MNLEFNRIFKPEIERILPFIEELNDYKISKEVLKKRLEQMLEQHYECWGIILEGTYIGVFGLWFLTRHYAGKSCEPDHVYIAPEFRKSGIGQKAFDWIHRYAIKKECSIAELNTYVSNFASHKFYYNKGYEAWGYHMVKRLS